MLGRVLPLGDEDVSKLMARELRKQKIKVRLGEKITSVSRKGRAMVAEIEGSDEEERADLVLVSVGRTMNTRRAGS